MSVWMTEEAWKWSLRFCCRKSLWQQRGFLATASSQDTSFPSQPHARIWGPRLNRLCPSRRLASAVRFYSQGRNHSGELEGDNHANSKLTELYPAAEIQFDETDSEQKQRRSPFFDHLQRCGSPADVLDLTCKYSPTGRQVSNCLTQMWSSMKKMSEDQRRYELQLMFEHPTWKTFKRKKV